MRPSLPPESAAIWICAQMSARGKIGYVDKKRGIHNYNVRGLTQR